jgi:hypothetical protein
MLGLGLGLNKGTTIKTIIQELKDAGAVFALLSNKADGVGPLTGNDGPWKDLINNNDGTLVNFSGTVGSQWVSGGGLQFDAIDDYVGFSSNSAIDITTYPIALGATFKHPTGGGLGYIMSKGLDDTPSVQYGLFSYPGSTEIRFFLNGSSRIVTEGATVDVYHNVLFYADGINIYAYIDGNLYDTAPYSTTMSNQPNFQLGARSDSIDGLSKSAMFSGELVTQTIYTGSDVDKILDIEAKISAPYLALNP